MNKNVIGELTIMKQINIKPNFSELSRIYQIDRHTIANYYYKGGLPIKMKKEKHSYLDSYHDEIVNKMNQPGTSKMAVFQYMADKHGESVFRSYSTFSHYTRKLGIQKQKHSKPHVFYETAPGKHIQIDWKENIKMTSKKGEEFIFNVFSATLGFSRMHFFIFSYTKTTEDFLRCTIDVINRLGGMPKEILTDNMTAIVSIHNGHKKRHTIIKQFEKDTDLKIRLCKVRTPETKGKVESSNRFMSWLLPYDEEFEDEADLLRILERIENKCNNKVHPVTQIPPVVLFRKEKEYLKPVNNRIVLDSYISRSSVQTVPQTLLVQYEGCGYSVPPQFMNQRVKIVPIDSKLYIYDSTKLIAMHDITRQKRNYQEAHYISALQMVGAGKDDKEIERMAQENLARLSQLGGEQS